MEQKGINHWNGSVPPEKPDWEGVALWLEIEPSRVSAFYVYLYARARQH